MPLIRPFAGLRPAPNAADAVLAPPYDVLSRQEAQMRAEGRRWSFLHVSRAEIDLPEQTDPYDAAVYAASAQNFQRMLAEGILVRDKEPCYYVYRLVMAGHVQTGLVLTASVAAYDAGRIKKHEFTRPAKEDDRVRQIEALGAQTGPVLLAYPARTDVETMLAAVALGRPALDVTADDGVRHSLWPVCADENIRAISEAFEAMDALYIADGHHRSAAASRVAASRRADNPEHTGEEAYNYFLAVAFPHDQMRILDYNRVVRDLNGLDELAFLAAINTAFTVRQSDEPVRPLQAGEFGMYLGRHWYQLHIRSHLLPEGDAVARLDVSLLQQHLIGKVLGIDDPRKDPRIDFVGGIRGLQELQRRVDGGDMAVAFSLCPTSMQQLMDVADAGRVMPPKSTWFEPKLADGVVSHLLE